jgi:plastocyanin
MRKWLALLLACLALGLVVAGCGGDDEESGGDDAANTEQPAETGSAGGGGGGDGGGGAGAEVVMEGIRFDPTEVSVAVGDTVTWVNNDSVGHDVTADQFSSGEPGAMNSGDTFEHTFEKAGTFDYVCSVHPGMEGSVTVE